MVLRSAVRVVVIAVGTMFVGLVGAMTGISRLNVAMAVMMRTVLVMALVLALTRAFRVSDRRAVDHEGRLYPQVLMAGGLAYVVNISSWGGHTLFGQLLVPAGVFSALIDFVFWMVVAIAGVFLGERARVQANAAPIPYA
jgi:hypothetical protein